MCKRLESPHCSCGVVGAEPAAGWGGLPRPFLGDALLSWTRKHKIVRGERVTWWMRKFGEVDRAGGHSCYLILQDVSCLTRLLPSYLSKCQSLPLPRLPPRPLNPSNWMLQPRVSVDGQRRRTRLIGVPGSRLSLFSASPTAANWYLAMLLLSSDS